MNVPVGIQWIKDANLWVYMCHFCLPRNIQFREDSLIVTEDIDLFSLPVFMHEERQNHVQHTILGYVKGFM